MLRINILSPVRKGGPYFQSQQLALELNKRRYKAKHLHRMEELVLSPFYQDCDIVHVCGIPLCLRTWKKPVVLNVEGDYRREWNIWRGLFPLSIRMADNLVTPSLFLKETLGLKGAIVIPAAVNLDHFEPINHVKKEVLNLLAITNFHIWEKARGVISLANILEKISHKRFSLKFTVLGAGKYLGNIKKECVSMPFEIHFAGFQDPRKYLSDSDIFIHYSYLETFGVVLLEAMASGLPVVTNEIGAVGEIIENGVDGFVARNNGDYTEKLVALIRNVPLRQTVGQKAREKVERSFSWDTVVQKWIRLYEEML